MKLTREEVLENALQKIARWHDEFPPTGQTWQDGTPISYGAAYGSNGERDYMRQVALDALSAATTPCQSADAVAPGECGSVPDEPSDDESIIACLRDDAAKVMQANPGDEMATTMLVAAIRLEQLLSRMRPANNQPKSDSVHLAVPAETSTDPRVDASDLNLLESCINWLDSRSETVWAKEYCYRSLMRAYAEGLNKIRADLQSGISSLDRSPNEKDVVGEGK